MPSHWDQADSIAESRLTGTGIRERLLLRLSGRSRSRWIHPNPESTMRRYPARRFALIIASMFLLASSPKAETADLSLMTYNIRLDLASDGPDQWAFRRQQLAELIKFVAPDIIGIQEGLYPQVQYLDEALDTYAYLGVGRDDGKHAGEHSALFYRIDRAKPLTSSTFWLSETPAVPSFGWGATFRRVCTYARFQDLRSQQVYWVFNTHFDHEAEAARRNGAQLILERIEQLVPADEPCFLMGDLNGTPDQEPIRILAARMDDARLTAKGAVFGSEATFNGFDVADAPERRIDYIFASRGKIETLDYATLSDLVNGRYLSDHFPVVARFRIGDSATHTTRTPSRIRISEDRRHLTDESGQPFFWLGDTAWELFHRLNRMEAVSYLQTRADQGFTVIQAVALAELEGLTTPNAYGDLPLIDNDPARPNEAYFEHVDFIVKEANQRGLVIGMLPSWGDKFNKRWGVGPEVLTPENARAFGRFMGARYKRDSIVWILGGDRIPEEEDDFQIIAAMARGLAEGDGGAHLMTYHPMGRQRSSRFFHAADWLDFNMHQSGHSNESYPNYNDTLADYRLAPPKPTLDGEPCYEDHPINWKPDELGWFDDFDSRRAGYWSMLSGAMGHTYGNHNVWQFWQPGRPPISHARAPWQQAVHYPGAWQAGYVRKVFEAIAWQTLRPAQELLRSGPKEASKTVVVAADDERSLIAAYSPFGSAFMIDLSDRPPSAGVNARWFNPRDAKSIPFNVSKISGNVAAFDPPGEEGRGNDWLLLIEVSSAHPDNKLAAP